MFKKMCLCFLAAALLTAAGCGQQELSKPPVEKQPEIEETPQMAGQYESIEAYAWQQVEGHDTVELRVWEVPSQSLAEEPVAFPVMNRRLLDLRCGGSLDGLAPRGTLESWGYHWSTQLDLSEIDPEDIVQAGGAYMDEYWYYSSGYSTMVIALRYPDGSYDVLYDETNVEFSHFSGYHDNMEESIHDWYVKEYGLDRPLYVQDWIDRVTVPEGGSLGNFPVHRFDGDGWYIYIPISSWSRVLPDLREGKHWEWTSDYGTGSTLTVDRFSQSPEDEYSVSRKQGYTAVDDSKQVWERRADGITSYYYFFAAPDGGSWRVEISWVDANISDYPYIAMEPEVLRLMAESFCVDETMQNIRELTASEIQQVNEAFEPMRIDTEHNWAYTTAISCFFTSHYDTVKQLDLAKFLRNFPGDTEEHDVVSEAEFHALRQLESWPFGWAEVTQEQMPVPIHKFTYKEINRALERYAGITLEDLTDPGSGEGLYHLPEYEAYYNTTSDVEHGVFRCTRGETDGDVVKLYEESSGGTDALTLHKKNGQFYIVSHVSLETQEAEGQETVELEGAGLTLVLPDSWKGNYAVEYSEAGNEWYVYAPAIRDAMESDSETLSGGVLFYIKLWDEPLTREQFAAGGEWNYAKCRYLTATEDGTYLLYYASDIQFTEDTMDAYRQMEAEIGNVDLLRDTSA